MIDIGSIFRQMLPQQCLLCGALAGQPALCAECYADLPWQPDRCCPQCGLPEPGGEVCGACLKHPPAFDATVAVLSYRFPVDALLRRYKYHGLLPVADLLGGLLAQRAAGVSRPQMLIPMPLHPARLRERGFNQAVEIARGAAARLAIPLALQICRRTRSTPPQAGLKLRVRIKNLRGAFDCQADLSGKHVALVDDIMTSGASLDELARAARKAGAARVECWVIARTPLQ